PARARLVPARTERPSCPVVLLPGGIKHQAERPAAAGPCDADGLELAPPGRAALVRQRSAALCPRAAPFQSDLPCSDRRALYVPADRAGGGRPVGGTGADGRGRWECLGSADLGGGNAGVPDLDGSECRGGVAEWNVLREPVVGRHRRRLSAGERGQL